LTNVGNAELGLYLDYSLKGKNSKASFRTSLKSRSSKPDILHQNALRRESNVTVPITKRQMLDGSGAK
jgi:hypothetical protein